MFENSLGIQNDVTEKDMSNNQLNLIDVPEKVSEENLSETIGDQVNNIKVLDEQIQNALKNAGDAKDAAEKAAKMSAGFWHRKDAIEGLQRVVAKIGKATEDNANSQKQLFDCLQKMAQVEKIILQIGCMSISMNRTTVRELELKLKGASKEKLSELAKKELESVIKQIRQQQDILEKQDRIENNVKTLHEEAQNQKNRLDKKDSLDLEQTENIQKNKKRLDEKDIIDAEQTRRLEELGTLLNNKDLVDQKQEEVITKNAEAIKVLFEYTKQKDILDKEQSEEIEKIKKSSSKKITIIAIIISSLALISSIVNIIFTFIK